MLHPLQGYRKNAGIILLNTNNDILLFERIDQPGVWQFPQGGIDEGETPKDTAVRELREETGITKDHVTFLAEYPDWLSYDYPAELLPKGVYKGQVQRWFFYRFSGDESVINLEQPDQEFTAYKWTSMAVAASGIADFKKPVYEKLHDFYSTAITPKS